MKDRSLYKRLRANEPYLVSIWKVQTQKAQQVPRGLFGNARGSTIRWWGHKGTPTLGALNLTPYHKKEQRCECAQGALQSKGSKARPHTLRKQRGKVQSKGFAHCEKKMESPKERKKRQKKDGLNCSLRDMPTEPAAGRPKANVEQVDGAKPATAQKHVSKFFGTYTNIGPIFFYMSYVLQGRKQSFISKGKNCFRFCDQKR